MNLPVFLNKWIIGFSPIKYTPFWWWYRLMSHEGFRFDDYHVWGEFWHSLNHGWEHMEYVYKFEEFWGKGSYPCLLYTSPSPRDKRQSRMPSSA